MAKAKATAQFHGLARTARRGALGLGFAGAALLGLAAAPAMAEDVAAQAERAAGSEVRRVAIHVDENDPARITMALNNAENLRSYYQEKGLAVEIRIVAYGPGLHMFRADTSPVATRIAAMALEAPGVTFAACGNTHAAMGRPPLLDEAELVPSGAVELVELQAQGWAYLRP